MRYPFELVLGAATLICAPPACLAQTPSADAPAMAEALYMAKDYDKAIAEIGVIQSKHTDAAKPEFAKLKADYPMSYFVKLAGKVAQ